MLHAFGRRVLFLPIAESGRAGNAFRGSFCIGHLFGICMRLIGVRDACLSAQNLPLAFPAYESVYRSSKKEVRQHRQYQCDQ
jgi:hypothetical protein